MSAAKKVVVITGASQGIGAELVKGFRERGHRVVATARSIKPSDDADILAVAGDIADPATPRRVISEAVAKFWTHRYAGQQRRDIHCQALHELYRGDYAAITGINLTGFFHITQLAIAEMEKNRSGHVVSITTSLVDHAINGVPSVLASLTKGGLNAATKSLAIEYAKPASARMRFPPASSSRRCIRRKPMRG